MKIYKPRPDFVIEAEPYQHLDMVRVRNIFPRGCADGPEHVAVPRADFDKLFFLHDEVSLRTCNMCGRRVQDGGDFWFGDGGRTCLCEKCQEAKGATA